MLRMLWVGLVGLSMLSQGQGVWAQQPSVPPPCDQQVSNAYQSLVTSELLTAVPQMTTSTALGAITAQLRIIANQYGLARTDSQRDQRRVAEITEEKRQLVVTIQRLQQELEEAKRAATPSPAAVA